MQAVRRQIPCGQQVVHDFPRRFGHILIRYVFSNIEIFQLRLKDAVGHYRTQFYNGISFQNRLLICPDHHVNMRVRIRIVVSRIPVQRRHWDMKGFRKFILLADQQLPPCCGIVVSQTLRVLTMQGIDDRPDVAVVRGKVVHCCVQVRISSRPNRPCAPCFSAPGRVGNVTQIAVFGLKILHM